MGVRRREFLGAIGVAGGVSCAGCTNRDADDDYEPYLSNIVLLNYHGTGHSMTVTLYGGPASAATTNEKVLEETVELSPGTPRSDGRISPASVTVADFDGGLERYELRVTVDERQPRTYPVEDIEGCITVTARIERTGEVAFERDNKTVCYN